LPIGGIYVTGFESTNFGINLAHIYFKPYGTSNYQTLIVVHYN